MKSYMPVYPEVGHIPLVIKPPGTRESVRINALTQTTDLMPTILDFNECPLPPHVSGRSLRPLMGQGTQTVHEDIIFGYFGMGLNITDGRHLYMRNPVRADGGPLHAYTSMPVQGLNRWFPRSLHERMEMGRYLGHTYNIPLYKIPVDGHIPASRPGQPSFQGRHELYPLPCLPETLTMDDPKLESHFIQRIGEHLRRMGAPGEQFDRLGLVAST
jgi:hypothetical protein